MNHPWSDLWSTRSSFQRWVPSLKICSSSQQTEAQTCHFLPHGLFRARTLITSSEFPLAGHFPVFAWPWPTSIPNASLFPSVSHPRRPSQPWLFFPALARFLVSSLLLFCNSCPSTINLWSTSRHLVSSWTHPTSAFLSSTAQGIFPVATAYKRTLFSSLPLLPSLMRWLASLILASFSTGSPWPST